MIQTEGMKKTTDAGSPVETMFEEFMLVGHYYGVRDIAEKLGSMDRTVLKISISLLRYTHIIPVDKAYFEAGFDARVCIF